MPSDTPTRRDPAAWRNDLAQAKGKYVKSATVSSTMGPGIRVDENALAGAEE